MVLAEVEPGGESEPWQLHGEGVSLSFSPAGAAVRSRSPGGQLESVDQLCAVSGTLTRDGSDQDVSSSGWRARLHGDVELDELESFRQTCGWFGADDGVALVALRLRKARGHGADIVSAAVLGPEPASPIADPRLSTTYDAAGLPTRVGLELWFETEASDSDSDSDSEDESEQQFPRRAAAQSAGAAVEWDAAGFRLHAARLRWHSRGSDGVGVYLLGRHA